MPRWFSRSILGTVVIVVSIMLLMRVTSAERVELTALERAIRDGFAPIQGGLTILLDKVGGITGYFAEIDRLLADNENLRQQIRMLQWENNQLLEAKQEVDRLRGLLAFKEENPQYELLSASVIARSPSNWYSTLVLNRGTDDGVAKNMVVITPEGLIGRVMTVSRHSAEVLLITDREGPVGSVVLLQDSRIPGIVEGVGDGTDTLIMKHIPYDALVEPGQYVVTSGLGDIFPTGIRIGQVSMVDREAEPSGLQKYAIIEPSVDFDRLEEVFIILNGAPVVSE
ncbi:MAG: rod shape-determining protein MreC [Syntrophomonadaceae bacterium]|nr:rod shape-determining protein MreC [Syntrophomonadaceae bacterium]